MQNRSAMNVGAEPLEALNFDNSYGRLPADFYVRLSPTPIADPYLVSFNPDAAGLIDLDPDEVKRPEFAEYFSGNRILPSSDPLSMIYAGHQFGVYVPQLGDGRAILLGEVSNRSGKRWDLQLKGAGRTPFSRQGDGRAVLRSTIREYLCSEAMHGLGIPTSRALCIVGSDQKVYRETPETAAVLLRLAPSHVRFGSFEVFYYRDQFEQIRILADYVITLHYPHLREAVDRYPRFLKEVADHTARLLARWQAVGFSHGVMNTDNMSILGLTFDYGPFGFMDGYDPEYICNHSDHGGRYAFNRQPGIGLWNLSCLAQALIPLMSVEEAQNALSDYERVFAAQFEDGMRRKLGLKEPREEDADLVAGLLNLMAEDRVDYPRFFRTLGRFRQDQADQNSSLRDMFLHREGFDAWAERYRSRLAAEQGRDEERRERMDRVNPKYVLRNYLAQTAIRKATEDRDYSEIDRLRLLLKNPYDEQTSMEAYAALPPDWAQDIHVSCSS